MRCTCDARFLHREEPPTLALALLFGSTIAVYVVVAAWALASGSSTTLFTTAVVNKAGDAGDVVQSVMISIVSGSIAAGGLIGGL